MKVKDEKKEKDVTCILRWNKAVMFVMFFCIAQCLAPIHELKIKQLDKI